MCISLTDCRLVAYSCGSWVTSLCTHFLSSHGGIPLHCILSPHFSTVTPGLDFSTLHHYIYWSCKIIVVNHIKINKTKTNQPEVPVTLDNLMLKINQEKQSCQLVKKSPDRASLASFTLEVWETQCKSDSLLLPRAILYYRDWNYSVHSGNRLIRNKVLRFFNSYLNLLKVLFF